MTHFHMPKTPKEFYEWTTQNSCTILPKWEELKPDEQAAAITLYSKFKERYKNGN